MLDCSKSSTRPKASPALLQIASWEGLSGLSQREGTTSEQSPRLMSCNARMQGACGHREGDALSSALDGTVRVMSGCV